MKRRSRQLEHPTAHVDDLSDSRIWLRLVGSPAARRLPIFVDIVPHRAGVTTVWFGSFDSLANQPNGPPVSGNAV